MAYLVPLTIGFVPCIHIGSAGKIIASPVLKVSMCLPEKKVNSPPS